MQRQRYRWCCRGGVERQAGRVRCVVVQTAAAGEVRRRVGMGWTDGVRQGGQRLGAEGRAARDWGRRQQQQGGGGSWRVADAWMRGCVDGMRKGRISGSGPLRRGGAAWWTGGARKNASRAVAGAAGGLARASATWCPRSEPPPAHAACRVSACVPDEPAVCLPVCLSLRCVCLSA